MGFWKMKMIAIKVQQQVKIITTKLVVYKARGLRQWVTGKINI